MGVVAQGACVVDVSLACAADADCPENSACVEEVCVAVVAATDEVVDAGAGIDDTDLQAAPGTHTTLEDTPLSIQLEAVGGTGDEVVFALSRAPTAGVVSITGAEATYTPAPNAFGPDRFEVVPVQGGVAGAAAVHEIEVAPVDDAPTLALTDASGRGVFRIYLDTVAALPVTGTDADGDAVMLSAVSESDDLVVIDDGRLRVAPAAGFVGDGDVTVTARAGELSTTLVVPVTVEGPQRDCALIAARGLSVGSDVYTLADDDGVNTRYPVHCEMEGAALGFTLVLRSRRDSTEGRFGYDSGSWQNRDEFFNDGAGNAPLVTNQDSKFRSYGSAPAREVMLMVLDTDEPARVVFDRREGFPGLHGLITANSDGRVDILEDVAGGEEARTAKRAELLAAVEGSSLQPNCNAVGFNVRFGSGDFVRVGILGNDQNDCGTPDSYLGFGGNEGSVRTGNYASANGGPGGDRALRPPMAVLVRERDLTSLGSRSSCAAWAAAGFTGLGALEATVLVNGAATQCR